MSAPTAKVLFQEGSMLGGSFAMVRFYDAEEGDGCLVRLVVADRASGLSATYEFDLDDLTSLEKQLGESQGFKQKPFLKALAKCLAVSRKPDNGGMDLSFKGLVLLSSDEKQARRDQIAQELLEQERLLALEQERLQRALEERLEQERVAAERELLEQERIANLTPEEREREALMKNSAYLDQLTMLIDMVDEAVSGEREFMELKRPILSGGRRRQRARQPSTFRKMELAEQEREEEAKQPKGQVDQDWDDPLELLAEYKLQTQKQHLAQSVFQQLSEMQRKQPRE
ncbi:hypothetical protein BASA81_007571 [Batrachochytrium salamandrivorans]|nr:hypothetical protein BASA81_007571 [Batrachochytrium salamandrivorans]